MFSLHTSPLAPLGRTRDAGGMNVYVRELARELGRSGIYVDMYTRQSSPDTPQVHSLTDHVRLISLPAGPAIPLPPAELFPYTGEFTRRVARFAERNEHPYDLVHSHYWLSAVTAMPLVRAWDVPHVTMFHTVERLKHAQYGAPVASDAAARTRIEYEGHIARAADCVTVSTTAEGEQLRQLYGLLPGRMRVIPCGVDIEMFRATSDEDRRALRAELGLGDEPLLLFVGRLDPIKGLDLLLESVALMRTQARLLVIGGNPAGDPELERLRDRAAELGIGERVLFPGAVPQADLPRYYSAAESLVITSRYESFGLAAVEALASGTPVVASAAGGLPSIIRDGENGLLIRWRSAAAFAERLDALLDDRELLARLRANARTSVERFDWRRIGDDVRALYQHLTAEARAVAACSCF